MRRFGKLLGLQDAILVIWSKVVIIKGVYPGTAGKDEEDSLYCAGYWVKYMQLHSPTSCIVVVVRFQAFESWSATSWYGTNLSTQSSRESPTRL